MIKKSPSSKPQWTAHNWPIAAAMIQYPNILPDGSCVQDHSVEEWQETLQDITYAGFTELDPTDSWLRLADLSSTRLDQFMKLCASLNLTIPAISTSRRSVIDAQHGDEYLEYSHRVLETAKAIGAKAVSFGLFEPLTEAQQKMLWFWTADGAKNPDDPVIWNKAVRRIQELGHHAEELGLEISLEMYEDTYLGSADSAVRFINDVGLDCVGINADIGNLIRLHRPMERWQSMMEKVAPYCKYWHVKNYSRIEDPSSNLIMTHPAPLESGIINYRTAIKMALNHGFNSAFLVEHYGGDGLSVTASNREYLRKILPRS